MQGRDWIRHTTKPKPRIIDDEEGYVPPRLPRWIPEHDDIDVTNDLFNRWVVWSVTQGVANTLRLELTLHLYFRATSLIVAPDAFSERQRVVMHLIKVARELRKLNNYFASHALQAGIRPTLFPGDLLTQLVERDALFKVLRSLEVLYADAKANAAYRLGLKHTEGPAIADLYVHPHKQC